MIDSGRGLVAKKTLKCGETIVSVPENLLITTNTVLSSAALGSLIKRLYNNNDLLMRYSRQFEEKSEFYVLVQPVCWLFRTAMDFGRHGFIGPAYIID